MLTLAAAATTIGVQIFSGYFNYRRSVKQGEKIRAMQQEFEQALQQEGIERAWEKLNQLQDFQKDFEAELHNDRIKKTNRISRDEMTLDAYKKSLENFPLRVPPFVMKGESIDTGIQSESPVAVALHCILCRSNDTDFNSYVYKALENNLSQYFTRYFGASSSHPVLFYSGTWKEVADMGAKIENIRTHIGDLPTLIISPWIPEKDDLLQFKISLWGIPGMEEIKNEIVIPEGLTYTYQQNQGIYSDDDKKHILKELTPLLEAFISYVTDQYYWAYDKVVPLLPSLLAKDVIDTQGNRLLEEYRAKYLEMFDNYVVEDSEMNRLNMLIAPEKNLELCEVITDFFEDKMDNRNSYLQKTFISYCHKYDEKIFTMKEALQLECFSKYDLPFLRTFRAYYSHDDYSKKIDEKIYFLEIIDFDYSILELENIDQLQKFANEGNAVAMFRLGEIYEYSIGVKRDLHLAKQFYENSIAKDFILAKSKILIEQHFDDLQNIPNVIKKYFIYLNFLSMLNVVQASIYISQILFNGMKCVIDRNRAIAVLNKIENCSHPYYLYWGAKMLLEEYGKEKADDILNLLKESADSGFVMAQESLMMFYKVGTLFPENPQLHFEYCKKAAMQGSLVALTRMGFCLATGYGITQSIDSAITVLEVATKRNYPEAIKLLQIIKDKQNE